MGKGFKFALGWMAAYGLVGAVGAVLVTVLEGKLAKLVKAEELATDER